MLKSFLIPIGCFGVPLTAGFIVLSASGVVDLQLFSTSDNEGINKHSKEYLFRNKEPDELPVLPDDNEDADDAFIKATLSLDKKPQTLEAQKEIKAVTEIEKKEKEETPDTPKKVTKRVIREFNQKIKSQWTKHSYQKIITLFANNVGDWKKIALDITQLLNKYWLTKEEKKTEISTLLAKHSVDIQKFNERDKKILVNELNYIIL